MENRELNNKDNDIELRKTDLDELLGRTPSGLVSWGITVFLVILILALFFCSIVRFPQVLTSSIVVTAEYPATWVVSKSQGKIDTLMVHDGQIVNHGDYLAVISNSCNFNDVVKLRKYLNDIKVFIINFNIDSVMDCPSSLQLGEFQGEYDKLNNLLNEYKLFCRDDYYNKLYDNTLKEIKEQEMYLKNLKNQRKLVKLNESIYREKYSRDSILYLNKAINITEFEKSRQQFVYGKLESSKLDLTINSTSTNLINLHNRRIENRTSYNARVQSYQSEIMSAYNQLKALLSIWENQYVLKSPVAGRVNFSGVWSDNQQIKAGEQVMAILPDNTGRIIGKCNMPASGIGKIKKGKDVIIKLDGYPFLEYGVIEGKINNISKMPQMVEKNGNIGAFVTAEIDIKSPLCTSYGKLIDFSGELTGTAEIITKDMTVLEQFISPLKYLFSRTE